MESKWSSDKDLYVFHRSVDRYELRCKHLGEVDNQPVVDSLTNLATRTRITYLDSPRPYWVIGATSHRIFMLDESIFGLAEGRAGLISPLNLRAEPGASVMTTAVIPFATFVAERLAGEGGGLKELRTLGNTLHATARRARRAAALQQHQLEQAG